jgi:hypothetical protein
VLQEALLPRSSVSIAGWGPSCGRVLSLRLETSPQRSAGEGCG